MYLQSVWWRLACALLWYSILREKWSAFDHLGIVLGIVGKILDASLILVLYLKREVKCFWSSRYSTRYSRKDSRCLFDAKATTTQLLFYLYIHVQPHSRPKLLHNNSQLQAHTRGSVLPHFMWYLVAHPLQLDFLLLHINPLIGLALRCSKENSVSRSYRKCLLIQGYKYRLFLSGICHSYSSVVLLLKLATQPLRVYVQCCVAA